MTVPASSVFSVETDDLRLPADLPSPTPDNGEVIVVLAEEGARSAGWAGRAAVSLVERWSGAGNRVLLADVDLKAAPLHGILGVENGEGVSDLILWGASPTRVARSAGNGRFQFVSAGTVVSEPERIYAHARWPRLLGAFRESGSVLVLYVPAEASGIAGLVSEGDRIFRITARPPENPPEPGIVVLSGSAAATGADTADAEAETADAAGTESRASGTEAEFGEPIPPSADPLVPMATDASAPGEAGAGAPSLHDLAAARPSERATPRSGPGPGDRAPASTPGKGSKSRGQPAERRIHAAPLILIVILGLALGALFVAAWLGYATIPGIPLPPSSIGPAPALQPPGS